MKDAPVTPQDVMSWVRESLAECQGQYDVQDLSFVRKAVRVVTKTRDACFEVEAARWGALNDPVGRPALTEDLRNWARRSLSR